MISFHHVFKQDYDKMVHLGGKSAFCYSEKIMDRLYPEKIYTVVGEVKSEKKQSKKKSRDTRSIGQLLINGKSVDVFPRGTHKGLAYKREGFVCIGEGKFVSVHSSRIPFLIILLSLLVMIAVVLVLIINLIGNKKTPEIINPDHPLPELDPGIESLPGDESDKAPSSDGGGFVSMIYTKEANVKLSSNKATIYYQNPHKSNHSVLLEVYLVSNDQEYLLGKTGLVPTGSAIYELDVSERKANIRPGIYTGLYRTYYYDPTTGQRAPVSSDIPNITVIVKD